MQCASAGDVVARLWTELRRLHVGRARPPAPSRPWIREAARPDEPGDRPNG